MRKDHILYSLNNPLTTAFHGKLLFTRSESAQLLSISLRTLDHLQARKEIKTRRVGRKVLIPASELARFAQQDHVGRPAAQNSKTGDAE
jgi:excisionase family DNA binding protein